VRIEQERRNPRRIKARSRRNAREGRRLAGHPALIGGNDMARLASPASKLLAIARIGRKYRLGSDHYGQAATNKLQVEADGVHESRPFSRAWPFLIRSWRYALRWIKAVGPHLPY
jgi:hypothetical protein